MGSLTIIVKILHLVQWTEDGHTAKQIQYSTHLTKSTKLKKVPDEISKKPLFSFFCSMRFKLLKWGHLSKFSSITMVVFFRNYSWYTTKMMFVEEKKLKESFWEKGGRKKNNPMRFMFHLSFSSFKNLRAFTEKQRLRVIDGCFTKSFFLYTLRKNQSWGTKYVNKRTIPFIFFSRLAMEKIF